MRIASHVALLVIAVLVLVLSQVDLPAWEAPILAAAPAQEVSAVETAAPAFIREPVGGSPLLESGALLRAPVPFTQIPDRPREGVITYTVQLEDTVLAIAEQFHLNPNTIIWANQEDLSLPFFMEVGQNLRIPPVDGVLHTVTDKDTLDSIAKKYKAEVDRIVAYPANALASADAPLTPGQVLIVPDGDRTPPQPPAVARAPSAPWRGGNFVWPAYGRLTQGFHRLPSGAGHRRAARHDRGRGRRRHRRGGRLEQRRLRQLHRDPPRRRVCHPLCAPQPHRRVAGRLRVARPADRRGRLHRPLHRPAPALRDLDGRTVVQPVAVSAVGLVVFDTTVSTQLR